MARVAVHIKSKGLPFFPHARLPELFAIEFDPRSDADARLATQQVLEWAGCRLINHDQASELGKQIDLAVSTSRVTQP
jgi:hypothetical protein